MEDPSTRDAAITASYDLALRGIAMADALDIAATFGAYPGPHAADLQPVGADDWADLIEKLRAEHTPEQLRVAAKQTRVEAAREVHRLHLLCVEQDREKRSRAFPLLASGFLRQQYAPLMAAWADD